MASFETALRALNTMKEDGVIADYAVAGGMAQGFWVEAIATYDLDVLVSLPQAEGIIVSLAQSTSGPRSVATACSRSMS